MIPARLQSIYRTLISNPGKIFLADGSGALLTCLVLLFILPSLEEWIGLPQEALYFLAGVACLYAAYSFCCYFFIRKRRTLLLRIIAWANVWYCILTILVLVLYRERTGAWTLAYFLVEIPIIGSLAYMEWKAASTPK